MLTPLHIAMHKLVGEIDTCGLYYEPITIVNDYSSIVNKLATSLIDDDRVIIYDCHMFIEKAWYKEC